MLAKIKVRCPKSRYTLKYLTLFKDFNRNFIKYLCPEYLGKGRKVRSNRGKDTM